MVMLSPLRTESNPYKTFNPVCYTFLILCNMSEGVVALEYLHVTSSPPLFLPSPTVTLIKPSFVSDNNGNL